MMSKLGTWMVVVMLAFAVSITGCSGGSTSAMPECKDHFAELEITEDEGEWPDEVNLSASRFGNKLVCQVEVTVEEGADIEDSIIPMPLGFRMTAQRCIWDDGKTAQGGELKIDDVPDDLIGLMLLGTIYEEIGEVMAETELCHKRI